MNPDPQLDKEQAFLLYATFCGDIEKTAHALDIRPVDVLRVADECGWNSRLKGIIELKKSARPGDIERSINRALNFVQAHKLRLIVERAIRRLCDMSEAEFEQYVFTGEHKDGGKVAKLTTRALADLASAMEKCQAMSYQALSDTAQDRSKRDESSTSGDSGGQLHSKIAEAMAAVRKDNSPRAQLLDTQLAYAAEIKASKTAIPPPVNPYDR